MVGIVKLGEGSCTRSGYLEKCKSNCSRMMFVMNELTLSTKTNRNHFGLKLDFNAV